MLMSGERAQQLGLKPLARFVAFAVAGVPPEVMGIGPIAAIPKALKLAGLKIDDLDLIELNEAFAAQSLAIINELGSTGPNQCQRRRDRAGPSAGLLGREADGPAARRTQASAGAATVW